MRCAVTGLYMAGCSVRKLLMWFDPGSATMKQSVYMDYNATAPVRPAALAAMCQALELTGNASSVHGPGRAVRGLVERSRETVAELTGCSPRDIIFTSGGTEANALAIRGAPVRRRLVSAVEHDSVLAAAGPQARRIPVDHDGIVDLAALEALLKAGGGDMLVSLMLANNETGVVQPMREVASVVRSHGAMLHVDAVQALGKLPLVISELGADLVTLSAHKIGGPKGIGALVAVGGVDLVAQITGGGQEMGRRSGTENIAGIAGFAAALAACCADAGWPGRVGQLRDRLEHGIAESGGRIFGQNAPRLATTSAVHMPGVAAATQVMNLDLAGYAVSAGSACSSGKVAASHVLTAMGLTPAQAAQTIRVSLGWGTQPDDVEGFLAAWTSLRARLGDTGRAA